MNTLRNIFSLVALAAVTMTGFGCQALSGDSHAVCVIHPTAGNTAAGVIRFHDVEHGVYVTADITGLTPNAKHGFHIHQWGDASADDGTATGGHYDPDESGHHGRHDDPVRHAGDLGNLEADAEGNATYNRTITDLTVNGLNNPIVGRAVIIHAQPDDFGQPTGNAGARIGQGVIGIAKPPAEHAH